MTKFIVMGNYTAQAFKGFIGNPNQDRAAAATALSLRESHAIALFALH